MFAREHHKYIDQAKTSFQVKMKWRTQWAQETSDLITEVHLH
jgi:hypothetical protein